MTSIAPLVILGGHSPLASALFHLRLLNRLRLAGKVNDEDYLPILHWSAPLASFSADGFTSGATKHALIQVLGRVLPYQPRGIAVVCNSLTELVSQLAPATAGAPPVLTPAQAFNLRDTDENMVVLAAGRAYASQMIGKQGSSVKYPQGAGQQEVLDLVQAVREQGATAELSSALQCLIYGWKSKGFSKVVLACTELSALVADDPVVAEKQGYVDTLACLLDVATTWALEEPEPN